MILLYNLINIFLFPVYFVILIIRMIKKKENTNSILERLSIKKKSRPKGKLIWLHAASVGESKIALTLIKKIQESCPDIIFLITTGTLSSAAIVKKHSLQKNKLYHQFIPLDNLFTVQIFLNHWKPNLGIFIESEFWPCLVSEAAKKFKLMVVNARLSDKSYVKWQKKPQFFKAIMSCFTFIATQSESDLKKYQNLGCSRAVNLGNLKFANKKLEVNSSNLKKLNNIFKDIHVFVASSTHLEDEQILLKIIADFKKYKINYYPIIILRHPERRVEISKLCIKLGISFSLRSENTLPSLEKDVYIVDNFGELGLFYSLSNIVFIGGSFQRGGHNLIEPAYFNNVIIFGPDVSNFQDMANDMLKTQAAIQVKTEKELAEKLEFLLNNKNYQESNYLINNSRKFLQGKDKIMYNYIQEIDRLIFEEKK